MEKTKKEEKLSEEKLQFIGNSIHKTYSKDSKNIKKGQIKKIIEDSYKFSKEKMPKI
jgi:hypothetical protein